MPGQVRDVGQSFSFKETLIAAVVPHPLPLLYRPRHRPEGAPGPGRSRIDHHRRSARSRHRPAWRSRLFMPVINVPFRLIFAYNPQRAGVLRQRPAAAKGIPVPIRRRHDVLRSGPKDIHAPILLLVSFPIAVLLLVMSGCGDDDDADRRRTPPTRLWSTFPARSSRSTAR